MPRYPGVTSALGCVIADLRHDFVHTVNVMLDDLDVAALDAEIVEAAAAGRALVESAGVALDGIDCLVEFDMLYLGQTHTVAVPLALEIVAGSSAVDRAKIRAAFEARYRQVYGRLLDGIAIRLLNLRLAVVGRRPKLDMAVLAPEGGSLEAARGDSRPIWIDGAWREAPVFERLALPVDATIVGPAVLEQPDATTFVEPGLVARVDAWGNLVLTEEES